MPDTSLFIFCFAVLAISILYASVGQAGASGYIALMALFGFAPTEIKPTAIVLNILVSVVVAVRFYRSGYFSARLLMPFAVSSLPASFIGGHITLPPLIFNKILGTLLVVAAVPFFFRRGTTEQKTAPPRLKIALLSGGVVGLLSGLTGVGGGILITPLILYCRWATAKTAAAVSAVFILINSTASLLGLWSTGPAFPRELPLFALAAMTGGIVGAKIGSNNLSEIAVRRALGAILLLAGSKLIGA